MFTLTRPVSAYEPLNPTVPVTVADPTGVDNVPPTVMAVFVTVTVAAAVRVNRR
jgi:hypothetical protein